MIFCYIISSQLFPSFFQGVCVAIPLAYILPAACYIKLAEGSILSKDKLPALFIAAFGVVVFGLGATKIVIEATNVRYPM